MRRSPLTAEAVSGKNTHSKRVGRRWRRQPRQVRKKATVTVVRRVSDSQKAQAFGFALFVYEQGVARLMKGLMTLDGFAGADVSGLREPDGAEPFAVMAFQPLSHRFF